eukprot:CAMPEP_0202891840 /NCGR_PEP_ID=MMETSP1392-20130828/1790_1 /ASSEMBLY_ACC=CAM_ASM_000868 /TAXON_ID=225041 /ORGANISM="Chlamydomonas chlamydogama, Strain SAG 11-48b" /LENGTH=66 /DNA_ID=CAMNT_0049575701 /DNA_START=332 /DNA_END=532 /DNA_ORIENTATION=-
MPSQHAAYQQQICGQARLAQVIWAGIAWPQVSMPHMGYDAGTPATHGVYTHRHTWGMKLALTANRT